MGCGEARRDRFAVGTQRQRGRPRRAGERARFGGLRHHGATLDDHGKHRGGTEADNTADRHIACFSWARTACADSEVAAASRKTRSFAERKTTLNEHMEVTCGIVESALDLASLALVG